MTFAPDEVPDVPRQLEDIVRRCGIKQVVARLAEITREKALASEYPEDRAQWDRLAKKLEQLSRGNV